MRNFIPNKLSLWLAAGLVVIGALFYSLSFFLLQDRLLTAQIRGSLRKSIKQTGLILDLKNVHWDGWGTFSCTKVSLTSNQEKLAPFKASRVRLSFDILSLLKNRRHPETALRKVELVNPFIKFRRFADGSWDFEQYFPKTNKKLQLEALFVVKNGEILFNDDLYGRYSLKQVNGKVQFYKGNTWEWDCNGISDFNNNFKWNSRGYSETNFKTGHGEIVVGNLSLNKIGPFIPPPYALKINQGTGKFDLKFGWYKNKLWLEKGTATISGTQLIIPTTQENLLIKRLEAEISPAELKIKKAQLVYNDSLIKASGKIDTKTAAVNGIVSGEQFRLGDLAKFFPGLVPFRISGLANLRVEIGGNLDQPKINGELFVTGAQVTIAGYGAIENISGQTEIINNNLEVKRVEGFFGKALISVKGKIYNIFKPSFDLEMFGSGLNLNDIKFPEFADLKIDPKIDFIGKITGGLWSPRIAGEFQTNKLKYKEIQAEKVKITIAWDSVTRNIQIIKFQGETLGGSFSAKGAVRISSSRIEWKISGDIKDLDLARIKFGPDLGINGKMNANAIFIGNWNQGEPFEPGTILGTFNGEHLNNKEIFLEEVQGVFSWKENKLVIDSLQARTGQGRVYGHLSFDQNNIRANINAEHVVIHDILPNQAKYPLDGVFEGNFLFEGPLSDLSGKIDCSLKDTSWTGKKVGDIVGTLEYANRGLNINDLQVTSDSGDYLVRGRINGTVEPTITLTVSSDNTRLDGFTKWLPLAPSLKLSGTGSINLEVFGPASNPNYSGEIYLVNPGIGDFQMERGLVQLEGDFKEVRLNRLELVSNDSSVEVSGKLNRENFDLYLVGSQINLESFNLEFAGKKLQGVVNLEGKLIGEPSNPVFTAQFSSGNLNYGPFSDYSIAGGFNWQGDEIQLSKIKLSKDDCTVNMYGKIDVLQTLQLDLGFIVSKMDIRKLFEFFAMSGVVADGKLSGLIKVTGSLLKPEVRINGELTEASISSIPVNGGFNLFYSNNRLNIEQINLRQNFSILTASGVWESGSELKLNIQSTAFPLAVFNTLLGQDYKLTGAIDTNCTLLWSKSKLIGECWANIDELYLNQIRLGDLQLRGKLSEQGFSIDDGILDTKGGLLAVNGYLPWPTRLLSKLSFPVDYSKASRNLDLNLTLKNVPAGLLNSYTPQLAVSNGNINGRIKLQGQPGWPVISGQLEANGIKATIPELPLPIENAQFLLEIDQNKVTINRVHGIYGNGKFSLSGEAVLFGKEEPLSFDLKFNGTNIFYQNTYFEGFGNLNLQLKGTITRSLLSGDLEVFNCRLGVLKLAKPKVTNVNWNPMLNIKVKAGKNVRYRQAGLADITVKGVLNIEGDFKQPLIDGEATSNKGILTIYGQTFKVNNAKAVFKYSQGYNPYIEVDSSIITSQAEVFLSVKGQVGGNLTVNLYSYPYFSEADLFALLNWSELRGDRPLTIKGVANTNISMVTDTMFGEVFYELRRALHLDLLYLQHDFEKDDFRISAGDFVTNKLFLSYSRSVSEEPKEKWGLEYHLTPKLITGGTYSLEEGNIWRITYRFRF